MALPKVRTCPSPVASMLSVLRACMVKNKQSVHTFNLSHAAWFRNVLRRSFVFAQLLCSISTHQPREEIAVREISWGLKKLIPGIVIRCGMSRLPLMQQNFPFFPSPSPLLKYLPESLKWLHRKKYIYLTHPLSLSFSSKQPPKMQ